ncbi:hypothetical protein [Methyloceanibacter sp.]|uniref:hypothetical protein n=1 Tax=Methyloceanibacter sp. TaxID=1965321 RepID=UPI003D6C7771
MLAAIALLTSALAHAKPLVVVETSCIECAPDQPDDQNEVIEPKNPLSEDQRDIARMARVYRYYLSRGETAKAEGAARALLQVYRMMSNRFAAISAAALEGGELDATTRAALRAYAYIPDGRDVQLRKTSDGRIAYVYKDEQSGKVIGKGILTPDEMLAHVTAGGMRNLDDLEVAAGGRK